MIKATAENNAMKPISHLHPALSARNPPITGPILGPRKGAAAKILIARPLSRAWKQSAITPPAFVSGEEPKAPAMNRRIIMVAMFCDPATPALKAVKAPYVIIYRI
jgi:hypothetical protein